jgi:hypothetical protein
MKRVKNPLSRSKSAILLMFIAAGISMAVPACKKDDAATTIPAVSQDDASVVINQSLFATEGNGLMFQTDNAVEVASGYEGVRQGQPGAKVTSEDCGVKRENSFIAHNEPNSNIYYDYSILWNWTLTCSMEKEPMSFEMAAKANISYGTSKLSAVDSSLASFTVSGLQSDSAFWIINQDYSYGGMVTIPSGDSVTIINSLVSYKSSNVKVSKETLTIVSGTADVVISGTNGKGATFSYTGTITYQGNYKALFTIKNGSSFNLTWTSRR